MITPRRGTIMLLTAGDPAIVNALAGGVLTARALMPIEDESPEAAIIRKRTAETLRRIDMRCRPKDSDDIETRILKAEASYGTPERGPSILRTIGNKAIGVYALLALKACEFFDFNNRRWKG